MDPRFLQALADALPGDSVVRDASELLIYESDALVHLRNRPGAVVLPRSACEVQAVVRLCHDHRVPFVARGHGTGLSGGALPHPDGVLIVLSRLNRILDVDPDNQRVVVEPGVTNLQITQRVAPLGLYYAPDPSSQSVCSIGGNIAENSGGAHCLKYGFTVHHVLGIEVVLPNGALVTIGGSTVDTPGLDLLGVFIGSEGTLGVVTKVTLRLLRKPEAVLTLLAAFDSIDAAGGAVSSIIAHGIVPAAVEMMDRLTIQAAEAAVHPNFPDRDAVLIVELDGPQIEVDELFEVVERVCREAGAVSVEIARDQGQRDRIWKGRKAAFAAMGRVSPNYYVQDGVVPRTKLPEVLGRIRDLSVRSGLRIGNVFHAGDGNLHPLICYDGSIPGQAEHAEKVASEILHYCIEAGGAITGEHGVGADKKRYMADMYGAVDLDTMQMVRCAFDPSNICNPGKVFPTPRLCGEVPGPYRAHPVETLGLAERV
ncbi:MAG: FAD-binding protein [Acidobacteria bacterium]|nr:FAD-binding protein [Acidobacteriota bacterium]